MLCKELLISGEDSDFIAFRNIFENVLSKEGRSNDLMKEINCILAKIYMADGDTDAFFKTTLKAVADNPPAEMCLILGTFYMNQTDYEEAALWLYNAAFETESILDVASSGKSLYLCLANAMKNLKRLQMTHTCAHSTRKCLTIITIRLITGRFQKNKKTLVKPSMISLRLFIIYHPQHQRASTLQHHSYLTYRLHRISYQMMYQVLHNCHLHPLHIHQLPSLYIHQGQHHPLMPC